MKVFRPAFFMRLLLLAALVSIVRTREASAIPVFARIYKTSCLTCHIAPPKLTPFGEAFRLNGYQIPDDDGSAVKEDPLVLGADGYKKVWPKAVWPGSIPGSFPLAFRAQTGFRYSKEEGSSSFVPPTLQMMSAGTFGEDVSFFVGAHLFDAGMSGMMDRLYLQFDNLFKSVLPDHLLYLKVGQFIPEVVVFSSNHRSLTLSPYAFNTYDPLYGGPFAEEHLMDGNGPFGIELIQIGTELSGIIHGRLRYVAGVVDGNGPNTADDNLAKDFYGRLAYKIGGKPLLKGGDVASQTGENWVDNSVQIGVFGYKGARKNAGYVSPADLNFFRAGTDVNINFRNLNLFGGFIGGQAEQIDKLQSVVGIEEYRMFFAEADYMVFPWLIPVLRYERADTKEGVTVGRALASLTVALHANAKVIVEVPVDLPGAHFGRAMVGVDYSF